MSCEILTGQFEPFVDFDGAKHLYSTKDGRPLPSVSRVLQPLTQSVYGPIDREVLARAAEFGTAVHACTEFWHEGSLDESSVDPEWVPYLDAYRKWVKDVQPSIEGIELRLGCHRYAGTLDRVCKIGADYWVVDLKTTSAIHPHVGVQLAAYVALAKLRWPGRQFRRAALQLRGDGTYRFQEFKDFSDETCFNALLGIYYWGKRHG